MIMNESAESAMNFDSTKNYSKFDIASQISINYEGECNALTGYYKLIPFFESLGDVESISIIKEIISDEKNHQELLKKLQIKYDDQIPVKKD